MVSEENVQPTRWALQFANGDRSVGDQLGDHVRSVLRRRFLSIGLPPQDADDLVQDSVALVFNAIRDFDSDKGTFDAWVSGYARNVARAWWRGAYGRRHAETALDALPEHARPEIPCLDGSGSLETAIGELHPIDQELLHMRFGFGFSFDEIAQMADLTSVNARKRVSRAVESLRRNQSLRTELGFSD